MSDPHVPLAILDEDHRRGPTESAVTVLIYGDYECPHTRQIELVLRRIRDVDGDAFRHVFRHFPLRDIHPHAQNAAEAAEAVFAFAGDAAFWTMHDTLFTNQSDLELLDLERYASQATVDPTAVRAALESHQFAERVERDVRSGSANGVRGTPSIFINGERYRGERDAATMREHLAALSR